MKIIEFIGTPGAGKTTLLPVVLESLSERGFTAYTIQGAARPFAERTVFGKAVRLLTPATLHQPILWQVFYRLSMLHRYKFFAMHPGLIWHVLASQQRRPIPADDRRYTLYWFFHLVGYYEFLKSHARPNEVLVLDEGFIHRVVQLNASDSELEEPDPVSVRSYIDQLPRPDLVIAPLAPLDTCEERIYARGLWKRFSQKTPAEVSRYLSNSYRAVNLALEYIGNLGWDIVEVDNSSPDPGLSKAELRRKLKSLSAMAPQQSQLQPTAEY